MPKNVRRSEAWVYGHVVEPGLSPHAHLCRVENALGSGTPDVSYACRGVQGWVELKVERRGEVKFEKFQLNWHRRRLRYCGGRGLYVLAVAEDLRRLWLWPSQAVVDAPREVRGDWLVVRAADVAGSLELAAPLDWAAVADALAT